jgi:hypothetical protein
MDEHAWYRQVEKEIALAVISADPEDAACRQCGSKGLRFQCQVYPSRQIKALCKACAIESAGGEAKVWVRTDEFLRRRWQQNRRLKAPSVPLHRLRGRSRRKQGSEAIPSPEAL